MSESESQSDVHVVATMAGAKKLCGRHRSVHAGRDGRDWLRLQRPQAQADLEQLHVEGDFAAWLLDAVLADRASVISD